MTRPCSSACTRCSLPGFFTYALSEAGVGSCEPDVGGDVLYFCGWVVCPRPKLFGCWSVQPAALAAASRSVIFCDGTEPAGQSAALAVRPPPPPLEAMITTRATTTAATSTP